MRKNLCQAGSNLSFASESKMEPSVSEEEKKRLNQLGQSIFKENGFDLEEHQDYDWIRNKATGYAHYYLYKWNKSNKINEADVSIYRQLVDIDSKLGTNDSLQLYSCLDQTTRLDLIKVESFSMKFLLLI